MQEFHLPIKTHLYSEDGGVEQLVYCSDELCKIPEEEHYYFLHMNQVRSYNAISAALLYSPDYEDTGLRDRLKELEELSVRNFEKLGKGAENIAPSELVERAEELGYLLGQYEKNGEVRTLVVAIGEYSPEIDLNDEFFDEITVRTRGWGSLPEGEVLKVIEAYEKTVEMVELLEEIGA